MSKNMSQIHLTTYIHAPADRVFDLSRSTGVHKALLRTYRNGSLEGATEGFIGSGDKITFGLTFMGRQRVLVTRIESFDPPREFTSVLVKGRGSLASMRHEQHFKPIENGMLLIDLLAYEPAYGFAGRLADKLLVKKFLKKYLESKNLLIKQYAESDKWRAIAPPQGEPRRKKPA
jgi:ligand-binding SRPBCC domain-containing protein